MDNTDKILEAVLIGIWVAKLLLKTGRVQQVIQLCQECLILLNNTAREKAWFIVEIAFMNTFFVMFYAYRLLNDRTSGIDKPFEPSSRREINHDFFKA